MSSEEGFLAGVGITVVVAALVLFGTFMGDDLPNREVPRCNEDAVLVGEGRFEFGAWTQYRCGPALDDFAQD